MRLVAFLGLGFVPFFLAAALVAGPAVPTPVATQEAARGGVRQFNLISAARGIDLSMSRAQVVDLLRSHGFSIETEADLPPDGLTRLLLAVPAGDDCLPRGARFVCPHVRVSFLNDPQRGPRLARVEAFQELNPAFTVADVFRHASADMGAPLQTQFRPEQVRGGSVGVWRQLWQDGQGHGPLVEILATQQHASAAQAGVVDLDGHAAGVGYAYADPELEAVFASVRRCRTSPPGG